MEYIRCIRPICHVGAAATPAASRPRVAAPAASHLQVAALAASPLAAPWAGRRRRWPRRSSGAAPSSRPSPRPGQILAAPRGTTAAAAGGKTSQRCLRKGLGSFVSPLPGALRPQLACLPSQPSRQRRPVQTHPLSASSTARANTGGSDRCALAMGCGGAPRLTCLRLMDDIAEPSLEAIPPASPAATPPTPSGFFSFALAPACTPPRSRTSDNRAVSPD